MTFKLLYIDDDQAFSRLVQKRVERLGYRIALAAGGEEGIALIERGDIDAVALDHYMPGQDGLTTLGRIREFEDPPPVIYVTAANDSRVAVAALKAGAVDYVVKDMDGEFIDFLDVAIRSAVAGVKVRRERDAAHREMIAARHRFEALAAERELLLREVNHRVGNSLQLVAAFLHLQAASADAVTKAALTEANRRVIAVGQVHRRLYESSDVSSVALASYLQGLVDDIRGSSGAMPVGCHLSLAAAEVTVDPDSAVAIGVVLTELVINAMKYAYPNRSGPIRVALSADETATLILAVEDDGVGMAATPPSGRTGIGKTIISSMAAKLNAKVDYASGPNGTRVTFGFAIPERLSPHEVGRPGSRD